MRRRTPVVQLLVAAAAGAVSLAGCNSGHGSASAASEVQAGLSAQSRGDTAAASAAFRRALDREPGNALAHYNLGVIAQQQGHDDVALQEYGRALTSNPKLVSALYNEATIYAKTDPPLAISTYRQVVALQPQAPTAYLNLGLLEFQTGLQKQGLADLSTALHQDPTLVNRLSPDVKDQVGRYGQQGAAATGGPHPTPSPSR